MTYKLTFAWIFALSLVSVGFAQNPAVAPAVPAPFPFVMPWDDAAPAVTDLSAWLDAPAGKHGFVTAKDGHLFDGTKRIRWFGVNFAFDANFPPHEDADKIAAHLAKYGIGCVRLHHMDTVSAPVGLLEKDNATLDPSQLDRLDYLISALKKHGIYVDINLHVGRKYPGFEIGAGVPEYFQGVDNFVPGMIALQRDFARDVLTHVNPYTKTAYANEPCVGLVEINNENALFASWWGGTLDSLPAVYTGEWQRQWNAWLSVRHGTDAKLRAAWNTSQKSPGDELLGDFHGFNSWQVERNDVASVKSEVQPGPDGLQASVIHVERPGTSAGSANFVRYHLPLEGGQSYAFSFQAKSDKPREVIVSARPMGGTYKETAHVKVMLTTEWKQYQVNFVPSQSLGEARFGFANFGGEAGDLYFAGMSLRAGGMVGLPEEQKLGAVDIFKRSGFAGRTVEAQRDWIAFLYDTETKYWTGMANYLHKDLHVGSLIVGTQLGWSPFPIQAQLDVIDAHGYWQHPSFPHRPWDPADWTVKNISMVAEAEGGVIGGLGTLRVAGKPFICTEYNGAAPNTYTSETLPLLSAYAALQDWDAVFVFAYSHNLKTMKAGAFQSFFDLAQHSTKLATVPASVAMFVRGDVAAASPRIVPVPAAQVIESIRKSGPTLRATQFGIRQEESLRHPVELALDGAASSGAPPVLSALPGVVSDTLDLRWTQPPASGVATIDTPRSAGIIGFAKDESFALSQLTITPHATMQGWSTVNATVVDGVDFKTAKRILVTATGYSANTGMKWKKPDKNSVGTEWGNAPTLVEGIGVTVSLPSFPAAKAWALDPSGQRRVPVPLQQLGGRTVLEAAPEWKTLWYEIETAPK